MPDRAVSDKRGILAIVEEIQAWLTLCLKELLLPLWRKTHCFSSMYTGKSDRAFNPLLACHDSPNVQFGITQVGISAAGGVLFHHQIRIRARFGLGLGGCGEEFRLEIVCVQKEGGDVETAGGERRAACCQHQGRICPTSSKSTLFQYRTTRRGQTVEAFTWGPEYNLEQTQGPACLLN